MRHDAKIHQLRSMFASFAAQHELFHSLALMGQCGIVVHEKNDALMAIQQTVTGIYLHVHVKALELLEQDTELMMFLMMHELRHLPQLRDYRDCDHLISFNRVYEVLYHRVPELRGRLTSILDEDYIARFKHYFFNIAADAALHEDLVLMFGDDIIGRCNNFLNRHFPDEDGEKQAILTVSSLSQLLKVALEPRRDWLYYAQALIDDFAGRLYENTADLEAFLTGGAISFLGIRGFDNHEFKKDYLLPVIECLERAGIEAKTLRELSKSEFSSASHEPGEEEDHIYSRARLNRAIKEVLQRLIRETTKVQTPKAIEKRSYSRPHRLVPGAPGRHLKLDKAPTQTCVLVLDTSGSMWQLVFQEQMIAAARSLALRGKLQALYTCDTRLHRIKDLHGERITLKGGGGTVWGEEHHSQIIEELNPKGALRIIYCTDEEVEGLEQALKDDRVELRVINIPEILYEQFDKGG